MQHRAKYPEGLHATAIYDLKWLDIGRFVHFPIFSRFLSFERFCHSLPISLRRSPPPIVRPLKEYLISVAVVCSKDPSYGRICIYKPLEPVAVLGPKDVVAANFAIYAKPRLTEEVAPFYYSIDILAVLMSYINAALGAKDCAFCAPYPKSFYVRGSSRRYPVALGAQRKSPIYAANKQEKKGFHTKNIPHLTE